MPPSITIQYHLKSCAKEYKSDRENRKRTREQTRFFHLFSNHKSQTNPRSAPISMTDCSCMVIRCFPHLINNNRPRISRNKKVTAASSNHSIPQKKFRVPSVIENTFDSIHNSLTIPGNSLCFKDFLTGETQQIPRN